MSPSPGLAPHCAARPAPVPAADFVVFGGTGDLAVRKLLPALYLRDRDGQLPAETRIVALSRAGLDDAGYRDKIRGELSALRAAPTSSTRPSLERFVARLTHVSIDIEHEAGWSSARRDARPTPTGCGSSTSPSRPALFGPVSRRLAEHGLVTESSRLVLEKPIGHDLASAHARSTTPSARSSRRTRSSGSTTTSARRACRTCS